MAIVVFSKSKLQRVVNAGSATSIQSDDSINQASIRAFLKDVGSPKCLMIKHRLHCSVPTWLKNC